VTVDRLAALKPRVRRRLPPDERIRAVFPCSVQGRDAVIVVTDTDVVVTSLGGAFFHTAPKRAARLNPDARSSWTLNLWEMYWRVAFPQDVDVDVAMREINAFSEAARTVAGQGQLPLWAGSLTPHERLVPRCVYLGGAQVSLEPRSEVDLLFDAEGVQVHQPPARRETPPIVGFGYSEHFSLELSGPGRFKTGGNFVGGGFGLLGAAEGMALASVLNGLTTRTQTISVIAMVSAEYEAFFLCRTYTPDELRRMLAPAFLRVRQLSVEREGASRQVDDKSDDKGDADYAEGPQPVPSGSIEGGLVATLERLSALHQAGALTDAEFRQAKARALGLDP
jgi:hypothetical protein